MPVVRSDVQRQAVASLPARIGDRLRGAGDRLRRSRRGPRVEVISLVSEQAGAAERTGKDGWLYARNEVSCVTEVTQDAHVGGFRHTMDQSAHRHEVEQGQCLTGRQCNEPEQGPAHRQPSGMSHR